MKETSYRIPTGTADIMPDEIPLWRFVEETARNIFERYGYREIRTPVFEETRLFNRSIGDATDIVSKEMYYLYTTDPDEKRDCGVYPEPTNKIASPTARHDKTGNVIARSTFASLSVNLATKQSSRFGGIRRSKTNLTRGDETMSNEKTSHLTAPMAGKIIKINVKPGDTVRENQPVIIFEAMKIEMEIMAPANGTVKEVLVSPGQIIEVEQTLATIV